MEELRPRAALLWHKLRLTAGRSAGEMVRDRGHRTAGQMAFFIVLAALPLLILAVSAVGLVGGTQAKADVVDAMLDVVPIPEDRSRSQLQSVLEQVAAQTRISLLSVVVLVASAASLMAGARHAVNEAWDIDERRALLRRKALDVALVPALALVLVGGMAVDGLSAIEDSAGAAGLLVEALADAMPFLTSLLVFALLYRLMPYERQELRNVWPGAAVAAVLLAVARGGLELYFEQFANYQALYGALSGVVALLLFIFASTLVYVYGAEFSAEWGRLPADGEVPARADEEGFVQSVRIHMQREGARAQRREREPQPGEVDDRAAQAEPEAG